MSQIPLLPILNFKHGVIKPLEMERAVMWYEYNNGVTDKDELLKPTAITDFKNYLWGLFNGDSPGDFYTFYTQGTNRDMDVKDLIAVCIGEITEVGYIIDLLVWNINYVISDELITKLGTDLIKRGFDGVVIPTIPLITPK